MSFNWSSRPWNHRRRCFELFISAVVLGFLVMFQSRKVTRSSSISLDNVFNFFVALRCVTESTHGFLVTLDGLYWCPARRTVPRNCHKSSMSRVVYISNGRQYFYLWRSFVLSSVNSVQSRSSLISIQKSRSTGAKTRTGVDWSPSSSVSWPRDGSCSGVPCSSSVSLRHDGSLLMAARKSGATTLEFGSCWDWSWFCRVSCTSGGGESHGDNVSHVATCHKKIKNKNLNFHIITLL